MTAHRISFDQLPKENQLSYGAWDVNKISLVEGAETYITYTHMLVLYTYNICIHINIQYIYVFFTNTTFFFINPLIIIFNETIFDIYIYLYLQYVYLYMYRFYHIFQNFGTSQAKRSIEARCSFCQLVLWMSTNDFARARNSSFVGEECYQWGHPKKNLYPP